MHILCSGIRYGNGERVFYDYFQKAWIQNPPALDVSGAGSNLIPTIHVMDLAALVRRVVVEAPKEHPYIFAIDRTKRPTQKRIVRAISTCMGTGQINENVRYEPGQMPEWTDILMTHLPMRSSDAFKDGTLTAAEEENPDLEEEEKEAILASRKF